MAEDSQSEPICVYGDGSNLCRCFFFCSKVELYAEIIVQNFKLILN